ncbi:MAG: phosphotransferase, partial [Clostridia bacterium]
MQTVRCKQSQIEQICSVFGITGNYISCNQIDMGIINTTYAAKYIRDGADKAYIVQKVNTNVFKNPEQVMTNISAVTKHIHDKVKAAGLSTRRYALKFFYTDEGKNYFIDENGSFWRVSRFIDNSFAYNEKANVDILRSAGCAFGTFRMRLNDFDASSLYETIPDFHNTPKRIKALQDAIRLDPVSRVNSVSNEISYINSMSKKASILQNMLDAGELPLAVTHNDTKMNNILFDKDTCEALAVIDLDTVMPGLCAHDFGDAVRFSCNTAAEDERDLSKVSIDKDMFRSFAEGYISQTSSVLTKNELDTMALGAFTITLELATRFLTDYINGDKYFQIKNPLHN